MQTAYRIDSALTLVRVPLASSVPPPDVKPPTDYAFVCDVSGSMSWTLPQMVTQICDEIGRLVGPNDTFSLIAFSGRGECETVLRAEKISGIADLGQIKARVRQYLRPIGMTGFLDPLKSVQSLSRHLSGLGRETLSVLFLTDGGENQWDRREILACLGGIHGVASWTFVQYGAYADGPFLAKMAETVGGSVAFANDFERYRPLFEGQFGKKVSAKSAKVAIEYATVGGLAFGVRGKDVVSFLVDSSQKTIDVPVDLGAVYYLTSEKVSGTPVIGPSIRPEVAMNDSERAKGLYAAVSVFARRMEGKVVLPLLRALGDVALCEKYSRAFGPVLLGEFANVASAAANGEGRYERGYDPSAVPAPDAFTILDLIRILAEDDDNRFLADDPEFKYSPIGRRTMDAADVLTPAEQTQVDTLTAEIQKTRSVSEKKRLQSKIDAIYAAKVAIPFTKDPAPGGYRLLDIVLNGKSPNASFLICRQGIIDLGPAIQAEKTKAASEILPVDAWVKATPEQREASDRARVLSEALDKLPATMRVSQFKAYAIVAHGATNVEKLPCIVTEASWKTLSARGVVSGPYTDGRVTFDLASMPVINQQMIQDVSAKAIFELEYERKRLQGVRKVADHFLKALYTALDKEQVDAYGETATQWLVSKGITGDTFNPRRVSAPSTDVLNGKEVHVLLSSLGDLPSVADVEKRLAEIESEKTDPKKKGKGKTLTKSMTLLAPTLAEVKKHLGRSAAVVVPNVLPKKGETPEEKGARLEKARNETTVNAKFKSYLEKTGEAADKRVKEINYQLAQMGFALAVGNVWPVEFGGDTTKNTLVIQVDGEEVVGTIEVKPIEVKI